MKDTVQRATAATKAIPVKLNASGILALFLGAMIFMTTHANASNHLCGRALQRCNTQDRISDSECQDIARSYVCAPEQAGNAGDAQEGYKYLKRRTR